MSQVLLFGGGLYGNPYALSSLRVLRDQLSKSFCSVSTVLNGDFHWFDADPKLFQSLTDTIKESGFDCTLGNVEMQLMLDESGCGCNYPQYVDDEVPRLANLIYQQLQRTAQECPDSVKFLKGLKEEQTFFLGNEKIQIVHGEPGNLNGWRLSREQLPENAPGVDEFCKEKKWASIACTHTCLPYITALEHVVVINNGALGMPNLKDSLDGLAGCVTDVLDYEFDNSVCSLIHNDLKYDLLKLPSYEHEDFKKLFLELWPSDSPAYQSYWKRISEGTSLNSKDLNMSWLLNSM